MQLDAIHKLLWPFDRGRFGAQATRFFERAALSSVLNDPLSSAQSFPHMRCRALIIMATLNYSLIFLFPSISKPAPLVNPCCSHGWPHLSALLCLRLHWLRCWLNSYAMALPSVELWNLHIHDLGFFCELDWIRWLRRLEWQCQQSCSGVVWHLYVLFSWLHWPNF